MTVSHKNKKNISKKRKNVKKRSNKSRTYIRKMKGGIVNNEVNTGVNTDIHRLCIKSNESLVDSICMPPNEITKDIKRLTRLRLAIPWASGINPSNIDKLNQVAFDTVTAHFGNPEILNGGQLLHASTSSSLLIFTKYSRDAKMCCRLYPTGVLLKNNLIPFGGELSTGITEGGINFNHISTIWLGAYDNSFAKKYLQTQNSRRNKSNINSETKYLDKQNQTLGKLNKLLDLNLNNTFGIKDKISIINKRIEIFNTLEPEEKLLLNLQFPVLYSIRINEERINKSIVYENKRNLNPIILDLNENEFIYRPIKTGVAGEIGIKDYIDHTEIKTIFVPSKYVKMIDDIINTKKDESNHNINIHIQELPKQTLDLFTPI